MAIFRYPGGKSKLLEPIKKHLYPIIQNKKMFSETFVGGGSVVVQVAKDFPDILIDINDKDKSIFAFWQLLANGNSRQRDEFYNLVRQKPNITLFKKLRKDGLPNDMVGRAYHAIFFNRCCFSGIASSGPIGGYEQSGKYKIDCRYNAERIIKEFEDLRILFKDRLTVFNEDAAKYTIDCPDSAIYLDPPYYVKGKDLYPVHMQPEEHGALADVLKTRKNWVLSYDICPEVDALYSWANKVPLNARYSIRDKKESWTDKKEYIILPK